MNTLDKSNMRQVILDSPLQMQEGLKLAKEVFVNGNFENIIICGIGGSAWPADILGTIASINIPVYMCRTYNLPAQVNAKSLVIGVSYSGNTEEPIATLKEALDKKLTIICIASGGKIESFCQENNLPFVKIPSGIQPRSATGYIFSALAQILSNLKIIPDLSDDILETSKKLETLNSSLEEAGKNLAKKLIKKIPVIYTSDTLKYLAMVWKIKFNENSKIPAFWNYFPELNHNEMVGYTEFSKLGSENFCLIILKDKTENARILKRMDLTSEIIKNSGANLEVIDMEEGSLLFKIFSSLLLGDWASYYLALENGIDPTPVKMVEDFKASMER